MRKFIPYYPIGCTLNNAAAGITGTCTCIQDSKTGHIWTTAGNNYDDWTKWCNHKPGTTGYDTGCPVAYNSLDLVNGRWQCGVYGWHLPTSVNPIPSEYLDVTNPGGDWSDLYKIAIATSAPPGNPYLFKGDLSVWMNNNGFMDISRDFYWASQSDRVYKNSFFSAWAVEVAFGYVFNTGVSKTYHPGILLVR